VETDYDIEQLLIFSLEKTNDAPGALSRMVIYDLNAGTDKRSKVGFVDDEKIRVSDTQPPYAGFLLRPKHQSN
jgi:hypothetical protein